MKYSATFWLLFSCTAVAADAGEQLPRHVDVFVAGREGYMAYRIPAIETCRDGSLLAFAEGRKYNLNDPGGKGQEIDLVLKRSSGGGNTWSAMKVIEHGGASGPRPTRPAWLTARMAACGFSTSAVSRGGATPRPGQARTTWPTWPAPAMTTA